MSYRFYPERVQPIGRKERVADANLLIPIQGINGLRVTVPMLRVSTGATAQEVCALQPVKSFVVSASEAGSRNVTLEGLAEDLTGALITVDGGDDAWFFSSVTATAGAVATLADAFPAEGLKAEGRFFVFSEPDDEDVQSAALAADSEAVLEADCPGLFIGDDLNYPMLLHITNNTDPVIVRGGTVVYINR